MKRRDVTINSLAVKVEDWHRFVTTKDLSVVVDPYGGVNDLNQCILRHTSDAFSEDCIRILRTARFAARYGYDIDPDTISLMKKIAPELNTVPKERIWKEFEKGLMEMYPARMMQTLDDCSALLIDAMKPYHVFNYPALRKIFKYTCLPIRLTCIGQGFIDDKQYAEWCIPSDCARVNKIAKRLQSYSKFSKQERLLALSETRVISDNIAYSYAKEWLHIAGTIVGTAIDLTTLIEDVKAVRTIDAGTIAAKYTKGSEIARALFEARLEVMK